MAELDQILEQRGCRYGDFENFADLSQGMKDYIRCQPGWARLNDMQRESLEMITHKICRIINGDPNYGDSWDDIAGYAKLVADRLGPE